MYDNAGGTASKEDPPSLILYNIITLIVTHGALGNCKIGVCKRAYARVYGGEGVQ